MRTPLAVRVAQTDEEFEWAKHDVPCISRVNIKSSGDYYTGAGISFARFALSQTKKCPAFSGAIEY